MNMITVAYSVVCCPISAIGLPVEAIHQAGKRCLILWTETLPEPEGTAIRKARQMKGNDANCEEPAKGLEPPTC